MDIDIISRVISEKYGIENRVVKNLKSSVGNVYDVYSNNFRYIVKIYNDLEHVNRMIKVSEILNNANINLPKIIKSIDNIGYVEINNYYMIVYEFLDGDPIKYDVNGLINRDIIFEIAKNVRKIHDLFTNNIGFEEIDFGINLKRKSLLHFDLTKDNVLNNNGVVEFIDFDDAKYGESVIDVSILISLFFISKKYGVDLVGIKYFIDLYYGDDIELKEIEIKFIKECALKWIDYTLKNNEFGVSLNESFENKRNLIEDFYKKIIVLIHNYFFNLANIANAKNMITIPIAIKMIFKISDIPKTVGFTGEFMELTLDMGVP